MAAFAFVACLTLPSALAQSVAPSPQQLNPADRIPAGQVAPSSKDDLLTPPEPGPCPLRDSTLRFTLSSVTFDGAHGIAAGELAQAYSGYIGQNLPVSAICEIRDRASNILFRRGILARVVIPEQTIAGGQLKLEVVEAYVAAVQVHGDEPSRQMVAEYIERLRGMMPFDIKKAQRYLFLASDVPGVRVSATLKPSPRGRGAIILDVLVTRDAISGLVNVQNTGSREVGPFSGLVRVDFNGFTPYGDRTTLVAYSTFQTEEQRVLQAVEEMRIGSDGLIGRASLAYGTTHPGGPLAVLQLKGKSLVANIGVDYPVIRSRRINLNVTAGFDLVDQSVNVALTSPLTRDNLRVLDVGARGSYSWGGDISGSVHLGVDLRQGLSILGANRKGDLYASRVEGHPDAFELRSDGQLSVNWTPYLTTNLSYLAQYTADPLLSYEELAVGNLTIGRGYDPSVISGDRGVEGSFEVRVGQFRLYRTIGVGAMGFFDVAAIENLDTGSFNRTLRSVGGGLTFQIGPYMHLDLTYAHPLDKISPLVATFPSDSVLMSFTVGL